VLNPPVILHHPTQSNNHAPASRLDIDLMSEEGVQKLTAVVDHVKKRRW
jgi:predicted metal-dependent TIM-barrel fold hydrolase